MFEFLKNDERFRLMTQPERESYYKQFEEETLQPLMLQSGMKPNVQELVKKGVQKKYAEVAYKSDWEMFKESVYDLAATPSRLVYRFLGAVSSVNDIVNVPLNNAIGKLLRDDPEAGTRYAKQKQEFFNRAIEAATISPDAARVNEVGVVSMAGGYLIGGYLAGTSVGAFATRGLGSAAITEAARATAFSNLGEGLITEALLMHVIEPKIDKYDWDNTTKGAAKSLAGIVFGLAGGFTYGHKLDKMIGNPLFTNHVAEAIELAKRSPLPELTYGENIVRNLVRDPDKIVELRKMLLATQDELDPRVLKEMIKLKASELGQDVTDEQAEMINRAFNRSAQWDNLPDNVQVRIFAETLQKAIELEAKKRATRRLKSDPATSRLIDDSDELEEIISGMTINKPVSGETPAPKTEPAETKNLQQRVQEAKQPPVEAPPVETPTPETPKPRKWMVRRNHEDKFILRLAGDEKPTVDEIKELVEAGILWQPNKMFDGRDPNSVGVFYGPATEEAINAVNRILSGNVGTTKVPETTTPKVTPDAPKPQVKAETTEALVKGETPEPPAKVETVQVQTQKELPIETPAKTPDGKKIERLKQAHAEKKKLDSEKPQPKHPAGDDKKGWVKSAFEYIEENISKFPSKIKEVIHSWNSFGKAPADMLNLTGAAPIQWMPVVVDGKLTATVADRRFWSGNRWIHAKVLDQLPLAKWALEDVFNRNVTKRAIKEGYVSEELIFALHHAYKNKLGSIEGISAADHTKMLWELEYLAEALLRDPSYAKHAAKDLHDGLELLKKYKVIDGRDQGLILRILSKLNIASDFKILQATPLADGSLRSTYGLLENIVRLTDAKAVFHEIGHWLWYHGLSPAERIKFHNIVSTKRASKKAWDTMWPSRKFYREHPESDVKTRIDLEDSHVHNPKELFADMFNKYVHDFWLTDPESAHIVRRGLKDARAITRIVYEAFLEAGEEIPTELRRMMDRFFDAPVPRNGKMRLNEMEDLVQRQKLYVDYGSYQQSLVAARTGEAGQIEDLWLVQLLSDVGDPLDLFRSGSLDLEGVIGRLYRDVLTLHHADIGVPENIEKALFKLAQIFDPQHKSTVIDVLKKHTTIPGENPVMKPLTTKEHAEMMAHGRFDELSETQYVAMREFFNELGNLYNAVKLHRDSFPTAGKAAENRMQKIAMSQEEWGRLKVKLADDELAKRGRVSLDEDGDVVDPADRTDFPASELTMEDIVDARRAGLIGDLEPSAGDMPTNTVAPGTNSQGIIPPEQTTVPNIKGASPQELRMMQLQAWPQLVSASLGFQTDDENGVPIPFTNVKLSWSPTRWFESGWGPMLSTYSLFNRGIRGKTREFFTDRMSKLTLEEQQYLRDKWSGFTQHKYVRIWREGDGLPKDLRDIVKEKRLETNKIRRDFYKLAESINKRFSLDEQRMIADIITDSGNVNLTQASPQVQAAAKAVNRLMAGIKDDLIEAGVSPELVKRYGEDFLPQVFRSQAKSWWMQGGGGRRLRNLYDSINAKFLAPQGITQTIRSSDNEMVGLAAALKMTNQEIVPGMVLEEFINEAGRRILLPRSGRPNQNALHTWEVKHYDATKGRLDINRSYTKLERKWLGEETSVVPRLVQFADQASKMLALNRAMQKIGNNPELAIDPQTIVTAAGANQAQPLIENLMRRGFEVVPSTESIPGIKRFGALAGKLVDPEAMYALRSITSTAPEHPVLKSIFQKYKMGVSLWKIGKTAFNTTTHGINFIGNSAMCVMDGRNPLSVLYHGVKELRAKGKLFDQAVDAGMLDSNIMRSELGLDDFMRRIEKMPNAHPSQGFDSSIAAWLTGVAHGAKKLGGKAVYWPMRIYELGDQVYKMGVFSQEMAKGVSPTEALNSANRLFFDYGDIPTGVKFIRDWGILPFVSYTYKLIPRLADFAFNNPHRMIALMGTLQFANEIIMHQEWGEDFDDVRTWQEEMMPEWMNRDVFKSGRGGILKGEQKNESGVSYTSWLDYSQVIPGADLLNDGGIFRGLPFGTNPVMSIVMGLINNKDQSLGNEIAPYPDEENIPERMKLNTEARLKFVARNLLPNLPFPGSYSWERLGQALTGSGVISPETGNLFGWTGKDYYGTQESIVPEMLSYMTGIRNRRLYADHEFASKFRDLSYDMKKEENELKRKYVDQRVSPSEQAEQYKKFESVTQHNIQEMKRLGTVYERAQKALARRRKEN